VSAHADIVWMCDCNGSKRTMCKTSSMLWISNLLGGRDTPNVDEKIPETDLTNRKRRGEVNNYDRSGARQQKIEFLPAGGRRKLRSHLRELEVTRTHKTTGCQIRSVRCEC
jgi:hypothetical protein